MVKGCGPLRRDIQVRAVMARQDVSEGHLDVSAKGAANWWQLLEKVATIVIIDNVM